LADDEEWSGPIADTFGALPADNPREQFSGRIWSVVSEDVVFDSGTARRDVQRHLGAVAVIALDDADRVLLIRQYRHPVGAWLFEPPAGLLDVPGEEPWRTAQRELAEEAGYRAATWNTLVDLLNSPGGSSEAIRIYLARDLDTLPEGRPATGELEENHLPRAWVPLSEVVELILSSAIGSPSAVAGILALAAVHPDGLDQLRPVDTPWPIRAHLVESGRVHPLTSVVGTVETKRGES
jgi:8-oxo-dGTP pyrophosphatase MutT (NUDIX family)